MLGLLGRNSSAAFLKEKVDTSLPSESRLTPHWGKGQVHTQKDSDSLPGPPLLDHSCHRLETQRKEG